MTNSPRSERSPDPIAPPESPESPLRGTQWAHEALRETRDREEAIASIRATDSDTSGPEFADAGSSTLDPTTADGVVASHDE
jgi:hypothetical protein